MKLTLALAIVVGTAAFGAAQVSAPALDVTWIRQGDTAKGELPLIGLSMRVNGVELLADEADVLPGRREFTLRGNVRVRVPTPCGEKWAGPGAAYNVSCVLTPGAAGR